MDNLILAEHRGCTRPVAPAGKLCVDPVTRIVYQVNVDGIHTLSNISDNGGECGVFTGLFWKDHDIIVEDIGGADVITVTNCLCVITREGGIITANMGPVEVETAGSVSDGILASCWSPDQELLVLVTGQNNLMIMTSELDPLTEVSLDLQDFGEREFINVGWGKKETQFHGSAGKGAAKKVDVCVTEVGSWDDCKPRISWSGDGQLFVVGYVRKDGNTRCLKVYSREGVLQATSEQLQGLEQALAWKHAGNLVASSQRLARKLDVIFFEKNGLKHGEFTLPFKSDEVFVKELMWSQDSSILSLWIQPLPACSEGKLPGNIIQLWTSSNYHWYLKQELTFEDIVHVCWDNEEPYLMYILTTSHFHCYHWSYSTSVSSGNSIYDLSCVGVIDGKKVHITPFKQTMIPPPMSAYEVSFPETVNCIMFAPSDTTHESSYDSSLGVEDSGFLEGCESPGFNSNNMCVFHGPKTLTFLTQSHGSDTLNDYGCSVKITSTGENTFTRSNKVHRVAAQHKLKNDENKVTQSFHNFRQLSNWTWVAKNTILACFNDESDSFLVVLEIQGVGTDAGLVRVKDLVPTESSVISIAKVHGVSFVALQLASGAVLKFDFITHILEPYMVKGSEVIFPSPCTRKLCVCPVNDDDDDDDDKLCFIPLGLSSWNRLYLGSHPLFPNCTSFHIHNDFLLVTTTDHKLNIIPLIKSALKYLGEGKADENEVGLRRIERGARIITAVPQDTRVIFQMPRGNLEVISPRPLAVHMVKKLLNNLNYHKAVDIMRKQRIDMNLLYDHNPSEFLVHVKHFVEDVGSAQWIDLFLANINEGDCTRSMYSFNYKLGECQNKNHATNQHNVKNNKTKDGAKNHGSGHKIETVCKAVREALISLGEDEYLLPILTSYVRMVPSQMDMALRKVKDMKDARDRNFSISADEGLRHLLYIADVNELYDVALGTYDFDLVMMVAEKSQKDPKEYLPFLNGLRSLNEQYRRFKVNVHLRQFRKALECLKETEEYEEECMDLIIREKLFKDALQVFPPTSNLGKLVCENYGNYLMSKNYFGEAALMFTRANKLEKALSAYKQAGMWRMVLVVAEQLNFSPVLMQNLCVELVKSLRDKSWFKDAAWVYENYLSNEEDALDCLLKASEWEEALRVTCKHRRQDLIVTHIKPSISEHFEVCQGEIERLNNMISTFTSRLAVIRETKQKEHLSYLDGNTEAQLDSDLYSDTSTVAGMSLSRTLPSTQGSSIKTYRSTKNRKKLERKKYSTKEGSIYEDVGLVASLHELFVTADNMAEAVSSLCKTLVIFALDDDARMLQKNYAGLLTVMESKKNEIWPEFITEGVEFGPDLTTEGAMTKLRGGCDEGNSWIAVRMRELEPHLRHPPSPSRSPNWKLQILEDIR